MSTKATEDCPPSPTRIVYLWGAGATQAEITYSYPTPHNLLMGDNDSLGLGVASRILEAFPEKESDPFRVSGGPDIEKLISLLAASNVSSLEEFAVKVRRQYFLEIQRSLVTTDVINTQALANGLLTLHSHTGIRKLEHLAGLISTNHDGLLQSAAQSAYGSLNLGIPFQSCDFKIDVSESTPPILYLHGSFTWKPGIPIRVNRLTEQTPYEGSQLWIPPSILKESKTYPFNKLIGRAYELLSRHCDVLRVVGASLTQNDWNILSLIFNAQRHLDYFGKDAFRIELIMPHQHGIEIENSCSYLTNLQPIGFLTDGDFTGYKEDQMTTPEMMMNPLAYWMKEKISYHQRQGDLEPMDPDSGLSVISGGI